MAFDLYAVVRVPFPFTDRNAKVRAGLTELLGGSR